MSPRKTLATTKRVLSQLRHDPRTLALLFVVPPLLMTLLRYVFDGKTQLFNNLAPMLLGVFPLTMMFLITSIATLRERSSGTLDRLMTMPIAKLDFILGYAIAFSLVALIQALITGTVMLSFLQVTVAGGAAPTLLGAVLAALLGTSLGLFASAFARSEFQAVQFMPAFLFPQFLTCGLLVARDQMATPLQWFANIMPLTYSVDAMKQVTAHAGWGNDLIHDFVTIAAFTLAALLFAALTIRRRI